LSLSSLDEQSAKEKGPGARPATTQSTHPWRGPQAVLDNLLVPLSDDWKGFSAKAHEFLAEGERIVCLGTYSGTFKKNPVLIIGQNELAKVQDYSAARGRMDPFR
jgi:hypothetical protein